ncbi:Crp/Fnr family transcriptional regulator [Niallia sp. Krafla_26]|uniref:Crp/Fnr family transcriptional regulator n=1 Tax=Niallia sp. Krafla_26 TaxID=3064703 RepID=UPI003D180F0F
MERHTCNSVHHKEKEPCPKKVPIFSSLSNEEVLKISKMTKHIPFQKGQMLIGEGEKSDTLYIINKGKVKITKYTVDGKEQILYIMTAGEFFGELNLFIEDEVSNFSAFAIENTVICQLTKRDIDQIMRENPDISIKLLTALSKRLVHTENLAQNLATKDPEVRIIHMILEFCQKFGTTMNNGILVHLPINREEIASYVGVTRETISRKFSKFEDLGLITLSGNKQIIVQNQIALKNYLESAL